MPARYFSRVILLLLTIFGATLFLACNPFASDDQESASDAGQVVEVSNQISSESNNRSNQLTESPGADNQSDQAPPETVVKETPSAENPKSPAGQSAEETSSTLTPEAARDLVWAYLTQCITLTASELEAHQIRGEWFVQASGDSPDKYGLWKVDLATGVVQPHNIRAREWNPLVNAECTPELFRGFFTPTPSPLLSSAVTEAGHAVTTLWAALVKCYPAIRVEELQATLNPAKAEWVVTAKADTQASYGVWIVRGDGSISPFNRQAQALYQQLGSGLC